MEDCFSTKDFWILYSALSGRKGSSLRSIIAKGDCINHAIMTKEELDIGLNKLIYNGYLTKDSQSKYHWTPKANDFYKKYKLRFESEGCIHEWIRMSVWFSNIPIEKALLHIDYFTDLEYQEAVMEYKRLFHKRNWKLF